MLKKFLSVSLIALVLNLVGVTPAYANSQDEAQARAEAQNASKVKVGLTKLGTGEAARVELKLRDGRKVKGYIREAAEDSFVIIDAKTGTATTITYLQVKEIKGHNLATGARVALTIGAILGIALGLSILLAVVLLHGER